MSRNYFSSLSIAQKKLAELKENSESYRLWVGENDEEIPPLCGAIPAPPGYIAKPSDMVAAYLKCDGLQNWHQAKVVHFDDISKKYKILEIYGEQTYIVKKEKVIPLPTMRANPLKYPSSVFPKGTVVYALLHDTCFYKGLVDEPPVTDYEPYKICFKDNDCYGGYTVPFSVPQRYVLAYKSFERPGIFNNF